MAGQYNLKNPGVKRILQEVKEMQKTESSEFIAEPLEDNIFEWHFAIRGPADTEFEGGIYSGRIVLPAEYPFKPPAFMFLTPTGRFEVGTKICLSISQHHPEHWQPSWSVRLALTALIAFMPSKAEGALGSLDYTKEERRALAIKSRTNPPKYGSPERQALINRLHETLLKGAPPVPDLVKVSTQSTSPEAIKEAPQENAVSVPAGLQNELFGQRLELEAASRQRVGTSKEDLDGMGNSELEQRGRSRGGGVASQEMGVRTTVSDPGRGGTSTEITEEMNGQDGEVGISQASQKENIIPVRDQGGSARALAKPSNTLPVDNPGVLRRAVKAPLRQESEGSPKQLSSVRSMQRRISPSFEDKALTLLAAVLAICIAYLLIRKLVRNFF